MAATNSDAAPVHESGGRRLDLDRLLRPRSIAAIGGSAAAEAIRQCRRMGYDGTIYPVHPRDAAVEGLPAYRDIGSLPEAPDAAFIGVNRQRTVEVVRALAERGAGGAVSYASGFGESGGEGAELQAALAEAAGTMPVVGPNCYGMVNYLDGALLWPDQHGGRRREGGVALVTQSSNIAINLTMNRRALPVAYMVTLGNQAHVGLADVIPALAADRRVSAIGLLIEGFDDIAAFARAVDTARAAGVPVVALRAGRSEAGAGLALSHTASLGGAERLAAARLKALGVAEVNGLGAFMETLKLLDAGGPLAGADIASLSCSGGEAILMADAGRDRAVRFPGFSPARKAAVEATVSELVTVSNPFDYHTFMWGDAPAMTETFSAVMESGFDLTCLVLDLPRADRCDDALWRPSMEALIAAAHRSGARAALVATMAEGLPEADAERCREAGVAPLIGLEDALAAVEAAAWLGESAVEPASEDVQATRVVSAAPGGDAQAAAQSLTEPDAKERLAAFGVPVPDGRRVPADSDGAAAVAAAEAIGYPVVVKAVAPDMAHKTEAGGVVLGLEAAESVRAAAKRLAALGPELLVERMVADGVCEMLVGYQHDPVHGAFLIVGSGGVLVELLADSVAVPLPAGRAEIAAAVDGLRAARLLDGFRGRPAGDRAALVDAIAAIGAYCAANVDDLAELDVNPLIVRPAGSGVVAADALIRVRGAASDDAGSGIV